MIFYKFSLIWKFFKLGFLYPVNINLNYWWNYGVLAFFCLFLQLITGVFLSMNYTSDALTAFQSVEYIMRDINYGWLLRYLHSNGASFFFIIVYIHIFRSIFYNNFLQPKSQVWTTGVLILLFMILTAFLGYVLPWGQMSFWAATVITNLSSVLPIIGSNIIILIWGDFSISHVTLSRFFSFHFVFPFLIILLVCFHIYFLHEDLPLYNCPNAQVNLERKKQLEKKEEGKTESQLNLLLYNKDKN